MTRATRTYRPKPCHDCGGEFAPAGARSLYCDDCKAGAKPAAAGGPESASAAAQGPPALVDAELIAFFDKRWERAQAAADKDRELLAEYQERCSRHERAIEAARNARDYIASNAGRPWAEVLAEARAEQAQVQSDMEEARARIVRLEEWLRDLIGYERVVERIAADEAGPCASPETPPAGEVPPVPLTMREVVLAAEGLTEEDFLTDCAFALGSSEVPPALLTPSNSQVPDRL